MARVAGTTGGYGAPLQSPPAGTDRRVTVPGRGEVTISNPGGGMRVTLTAATPASPDSVLARTAMVRGPNSRPARLSVAVRFPSARLAMGTRVEPRMASTETTP